MTTVWEKQRIEDLQTEEAAYPSLSPLSPFATALQWDTRE